MNVLYSVGITTNPTDVLTAVDSTISLTCAASGASNMMYRWMRKGKKMIPSQATGVATRTLVIPDIVMDDSGEYKCVASSSDVSVSSEHGTITVFGKSLLD